MPADWPVTPSADAATSLLPFVFVGASFGALAGAMAFLIVFAEYRRHKILPRSRVWRTSIGSGAAAFVFFVCLAVVGGYVAMHTLR